MQIIEAVKLEPHVAVSAEKGSTLMRRATCSQIPQSQHQTSLTITARDSFCTMHGAMNTFLAQEI